jgi:hypothetical protein
MTINYKGKDIDVYGGAYAATVEVIDRIDKFKICRIRGTDIIIALPLAE